MLARAMHKGMKAYLTLPKQDPFDVFPKGETISLMSLVPSQMIALLAREDRQAILSRTSVILLGGAPVEEGLKKRLTSVSSTSIFETFGMTETLSHIAVKKMNPPPADNMFETMPGIQISVDDRQCLAIKGKVTEDKWLETNDQVELGDEHHFLWKGRWDNVLNSGGIKIQPEEVERWIDPLLKERGFMGEFLIAGVADAKWGSKMVLYIEDEMEDKEACLQLLRRELPRYHDPKEIIQLEKLPRTSSGKIKRT